MGTSLLPRKRGKDITLISPAKTKHFQQDTCNKFSVFTAAVQSREVSESRKNLGTRLKSNHVTLASHLKTWRLLVKAKGCRTALILLKM